MTLALIRHGETDWNRELRLQGTTDIPLNDTGRDQAYAAVEPLAAQQWDAVVSSPLARARETAQIIAAGLDIRLGATYDLLIERAYGAAEGATAEVIAERWPDKQYPGQESLESVVDRGTRALEQIAADLGGARTVIVCHGTLIRYTLEHLAGRSFDQIRNGAISTVERRDGTWHVLSVNGEPLEVLAASS
jgi:uncharacterized phosphatase